MRTSRLAQRLGLATLKDVGRLRAHVKAVGIVDREERLKLERRVTDLETVIDALIHPTQPEARDGNCQRCGGRGCVACDARRTPANRTIGHGG